ncbi:MAG: hypothetical protein JST14_01410 [Bacteroidetes bacterium]|nr:hypothetical protein [Bacteroidota bacterium]
MKRKYKVYIILVNLLLAGVFGSVYGYYITTRIDSSLVVVSIIFLAFLGTALIFNRLIAGLSKRDPY